MTLLKWLALILFGIFTFSSIVPGCGKYEEGPSFSLLSEKSRLTGTWECEEGTDFSSGDKVGCLPTYQYKTSKLIFKHDNTGRRSYECAPFDFHCQDTTFTFNWQFSDDKDFLITEYKICCALGYKIIRLTNKELWGMDKNETYERHYYKESQRTE